MKTRNSTILFSILLSLSIPPHGQKSDKVDGTIFVGRSFSFILKEPAGWTMDTEIAKSQDLQTVLYLRMARIVDITPLELNRVC